uniref:Proprotein convertase subtilisin/kexin type 5 n=1 Tax=Xiphophorus couchianus TaxID=32473 RepID=A0A3B5KST8_9TELE
MVHNAAWRRSFLCVLALYLGFASPPCKARLFTNHWAVRIAGGPEVADRIAEKYGYRNMGQIGDLKDHYHFFHSRTIKRSTLSSRGRHSFISMEPKVEWIEQQVVKRRIKRDYKPNNIFYNDAKWSSMWYIHCSDDVHNCQSDMNIMGAWKRGYTGKDVVVTILDDGIERTHPDLSQNYDPQASYDVNSNDLDPMPRYDATNENKHGTRCAGEVAAAANNSHCIVGIAYNARIGGHHMFSLCCMFVCIQIKTTKTFLVSAVSHLYGFGLMDAEAMVKEAEQWKHVPAQQVCVETADRQIRTIRPEHLVRSVYKATGCSDNPNLKVIYLEHVVVRITITHPRRGDLSINLTSPSGTKSQLLANRLFDHSMEGFKNWEFMTTHCWGEKAAGDWILEIYDSPSQLRSQKVPGKLKEWSLVLYGTSVHPYSTQQKDRFTDSLQPEEEFTEEYNGPCDAECNENGCEGPGPHHCINCLHYFLKFKNNTRMCVSECPSGFFRDDRKRCKKCSSMCETCVGSRSDQCISCRTGYHLIEGSNTCAANCADGFYLDNSNICRRCQENCKRCSASNICTECKPGMSYLSNIFCLKKMMCLLGTGIEACTKCADDYLLEDWRCVLTCSPGYYLSEQTSDNGQVQRFCKKCDNSCFECLGPGELNCSSCNSGYNLEAGTCVVSTVCKDGEYLSKQGTCHLCDISCLQCTGPESEACTVCPDTRLKPFSRKRHQCRVHVFRLFVVSHVLCVCLHACVFHQLLLPMKALISFFSRFNPDRLGEPRYLFQNQCREACPEGFFHSAMMCCEPCPAECVVCTAADRCVQCSSRYRLRNGHCVQLEYEASDDDQRDCLPCDEGCKKLSSDCSFITVVQLQALTLMPNFLCCRFDADCHQSCPDWTYEVKETMMCSSCDDPVCRVCDQSQCYWCEDGFYVSEGECVDHCQEGYFMDKESQECEPCHRECRSCGGPGSDSCDSCEDGFTLKNGECLDGKQLATCPEGQFKNSASCNSKHFLTLNHTCVSRCPSGTFGNKTSGQCDPCLSGCVVCQEAQACQRCLTGLYLQNGTCVVECQRGFPQGEECHQCAPECGSCKERSSNCLSCERRFLLLDNSCLSSCPKGYYDNSKECLRCPQHCSECSQDGLCKKCADYYFLYDAECVDECPKGYFDNDQECMQCHADCASCDGPDQNDCDVCRNPKAVRYYGECLARCPSNTYHDENTNECKACDKSCLTCSGHEPTDCLSCDTNRRVDESRHCVWNSQCSMDSYMDLNGDCQRCHTQCRRCDGPGKDHCLGCNEPQLLLNTTCVKKCPLGYYIEDKVDRVCERCHPSCESCFGHHSQHCKTCKPGFFKQASSCVETCSESHFGNKTTMLCERCDPSCSQCVGSGNTHCLNCREGYVYMRPWGQCLKSCPPGYYKDIWSTDCHKCHHTCKTCNGKEKLRWLSDALWFYFLFLNRWGITPPPCRQDLKHDDPNCRHCDQSCEGCWGPSMWQCTLCHPSHILADDGRCLSCCGKKTPLDDKPIPRECCDCEASYGKQEHTCFAIKSKTKEGGYQKLNMNDVSPPQPTTSSFGEYSDRITECGNDEEYDDEDIVYMSKDGTVYRKFKYGLLDDDDVELEYDDESYSYR